MGLKAVPARSTLVDALNLRDWRIDHALAQRLMAGAGAACQGAVGSGARCQCLCARLYRNRSMPKRVRLGAVSLDQGSHQASPAAGPRGSIPAFIHISDGKLHHVNVLDILPMEAGTFYVMGRGYVDFECSYTMHQAEAFCAARILGSSPPRQRPDLRPAHLVQRLLLCQEKQCLCINRFLGTSENAVKVFHLDASLDTCRKILSVSVFEKTDVSFAMQPDRSQPDRPIALDQLILADI